MANAMGSIIITVKGKDITVANSAPSSPLINDLWLDLQNDILKTYDGTDWVAVNDQSSAISDIQETLTTQGLSITQNANGISQLITNTTIAKQDGTVVQLKDAYNSTKDTVDSHTQTIGTLTTTVGSLSEDLAEFSSTTLGNIASLQEQIDGSIMTWFYEVAPTLSNSPASDWDTVDKKNIHLGDLYYDTITGYCYRWQVLNNTYLWQKITDTDVTKALEDASKAQDTADSKRRVFTTTPTTPYEIGDLWSGGSSGELKRCKVTRLTGSYISSDWELATRYTDDTTANQIANNLSANYSTTTQMNSAIDQKADSITSTVSATYVTKSDFNNLEIGGRNLCQNSNSRNLFLVGEGEFTTKWVDDAEFLGKKHFEVKCTVASVGGGYFKPFECISGKQYTWSFYAKSSIERAHRVGNLNGGLKDIIVTTEWQKFTHTFTANDYEYKVFVYRHNYVVNDILYIADFKIEEGGIATSWTPAPEDIDADIDNINNTFNNYSTTTQMNSAIDQKADSITSTVSATYATKNEVEDNLTNNYYNITQISTTLEQTTNSIMASVSDSYAAKAELALKIGEDGIARISAEADEIAFESDKFSVDSTNLKISKTGVIEATGAKITGNVTATKLNIIPSENTGLWGLRVNEYGFDIYSSDGQAARLKITDGIDMIAPYGVDISGGLTVKKNSKSSYGLTVVGDTDITGHTYAHGNILIDNNYGLYIKDADGNNRNGIVIDGSNKYLIAAGAIPNAEIQLGCSTTANIVVYGNVNMADNKKLSVGAIEITGNSPIVRSSSGVMQFSSASDSYVNYISGSEVRVCNLDRTTYKVIKASAFTVSSSRRLKHNIEPMSEDEALKLQKLNVVTFDYNNGESNQRGLIAEDTYEIIPSAVQGNINAPNDDEDAIMGIGIDYSKLVPYLIKNAQIQEKRIQALEAKILNLQ